MASPKNPKNPESAPDEADVQRDKMKPVEAGRMYSAGDVRILAIDDDPAVGRLVQATLAGHEFVIEAVSDPHEVEPALRRAPVHVVILDYVIPGLDSTELLKLVQETQPDASIIVVTAFPSVDSALQCLRARTFDYITKPFQVDVLKKTVIRCLEARGLLRLSELALREQLGAAIRERRKALGLTLAEMAKRSDVSLGYLSQIELGKNSASIETLYRIALGLRVRSRRPIPIGERSGVRLSHPWKSGNLTMNKKQMLIGLLAYAGCTLAAALAGENFDSLKDGDRKAMQDRFAKEVWPLLQRNGKEGCVGCHQLPKTGGNMKFTGDLDKDFPMLVKEGFFIPGDSGSMLTQISKKRMPPAGKGKVWTKEEIEVLGKFVADLEAKQQKKTK